MPSADTHASPRRLDSLDGLRGLAALGVVALHTWMFSYGDLGRPDKGFSDLVFGELRLGVQLFFVLSGFLVFRPFVAAALDGRPRPSLRRYALRRAARILPAYWLAVIGTYLLLRHLDHPLLVQAADLPLFLVFAQNQFDVTLTRLDPPMWTLGIEMSFYALLPLAGLLVGRLGAARGRHLVLCAAIVAAGLACTAMSFEGGWPATLSTSLLLYLVEFGAGMTLAAALHRRTLGRAPAGALAVAGVLLLLANSYWHANALGDDELRNVVGDAPGVAGMALLVAALAAGPWPVRALSRGPAKWLGDVSYGMYLIHFPVIVGLRGTGHWPTTLPGELAAVVAVTLTLATLSWLVVERPVIRLARRATTPRRRPAARPVPAGHPQHQAARVPVLRPQPAER